MEVGASAKSCRCIGCEWKSGRILGPSPFYLLLFRGKVGAFKLMQITQPSPEIGGQSLPAVKGMVLAIFHKLSTAMTAQGAIIYDGEMPLGCAGWWSLSHCRTLAINPQLPKHASICSLQRVLILSPFGVQHLHQRRPDLCVLLHPIPTGIPPSPWHHFKPHQKVHPAVFSLQKEIQDSAASHVPEEQSLSIYASRKCIF